MKRHQPFVAALLVMSACAGGALSRGNVAFAGEEAAAVVPKLKASKHSVLEGIREAQKENGVAISAKLELENGKPSLSVYTAKSGLEKDAEHNVLLELAGDATAAKWTPKTEVFEDKAHITRAAAYLTLMQTTTMSLEDVVNKAEGMKKGTVSVTPVTKGGKTVFEVLVASPAGKSVTLTIDESTTGGTP
jgi:hypothetical protein